MILVLSLSIINCSKSEDYTPRINTMQAKIDGTLIVCDSLVRLERGFGKQLYGVEGFKKGPIKIKLRFPISYGVGTYHFETFNEENYVNEAWLKYGHGWSGYRAANGFVIITEASENRFKGQFSFTTKKYFGESITVTDGSFEIFY